MKTVGDHLTAWCTLNTIFMHKRTGDTNFGYICTQMQLVYICVLIIAIYCVLFGWIKGYHSSGYIYITVMCEVGGCTTVVAWVVIACQSRYS